MLIDKLKTCFDHIRKGGAAYWIYGVTPEGKSYLVSLLREEIEGFVLFITLQDAQVENFYQDLCTFLSQKEKIFFLTSRAKLVSSFFERFEKHISIDLSSLS